jgi:hypothetical protein
MGGQDFSAMAESIGSLVERGRQVLAAGEI